MTEYADRDIMALDEAGDYYIKHVSAMTGEKLHSKSDIAAELGWRDMQIDILQVKLDQALLGESHYMDREQAVVRRLNNSMKVTNS